MSATTHPPAASLGRGREADAIELPADVVAFSQECVTRGWSDGLPVIPATAARVAAMLRYSDRDPLDVLAVIAPAQREATVQAVAINAVLAGCEPRHFPVLVAAVRGLAEPAFNIDSVNATTHPVTVFILVNGPVAREVGLHSGSGCFGPTYPANAAIGRAMRLVLLNIGGATPGRGDRATQGSPAKFAFCAAEREDASPWPPFHTTRGLAPEQSAVTIFPCEGPHNIQDHGSNTAAGILQTVVGSMGQAGSNSIHAHGPPILALGPEHAATVAAEGWTREALQRHIFEHARYPAERLSREFLDLVQQRTAEPEEASPIDAQGGVPIADGPDQIHILVAGGPGKHSAWMPGFERNAQPVSVALTTHDGRPLRSIEELRR